LPEEYRDTRRPPKPPLPPPTEPVSLRERQRQEREDAILDAAQEMMNGVGYNEMTMEELAARVGITKPTLYGHFPSKEAIAVRAIVRAIRRNCEYIATLPEDLSPRERLSHVLRRVMYGKFVERGGQLGTAKNALGPAIRQHPEYRREYERVVAALCAIIEEGKARGEFSRSLHTRVAVQSLFSVLRDAEYDDLLASGDVRPDAMINTLTAILLNGLRAENHENE